MKMRATRGSFTWQGRHVTAGHTFEVADDYPHKDTLRRLYGAVEADSARGRRTRKQPDPVEPETAEPAGSDPAEEVDGGSSEA